MSEILNDAQNRKYAVGYFEDWDFGSLKATLNGAEETGSPVIIGFGAKTFTGEDSWDDRKLACFAAMGKTLAERSSVPVSFMLNETDDMPMLSRAMELGFNCVMFEGSHLPLEKNIELTALLVKEGKAKGVDIEAELGRIPAAGYGLRQDYLTSPEEARSFVKKTDLTALAVSVGNIHMSAGEQTSIDLTRLQKIRDYTSVPLVMHGGTGFPDRLVPEVIKRGIHKFNVGSTMKRTFLKELRSSLLGQDLEVIDLTCVHHLVDWPGSRNIFEPAYTAVKEIVKEKIRIYGSAGMD
jgi:fructose-bisphosphate aldolase class II